ncbi:MAG: NAD-dependent epimerase/dehydratase family protein [Nitrospirae bacterium]|nr:NAD-dependent epimerase/dehydratase family protein [Nitrospirota bacterium]
MKCLVLGGGGFIGSHICDHLVAAGHEVRVFEKVGLSKANVLHLHEKIEWMEGDFLNPDCLRGAVKDAEIIFHLISATIPRDSNDNPVYDITSNIIPTLHLLEAARSAGVRKIILSSSGGTVYGIPRKIPISEEHPTEPICSYGIHKLMIEKYLFLYHKLYGLDFAVMRISNPYGERQRQTGNQGVVPIFLSKVMHGETIEIWGDGSVVRDYLHISDVARAAVMMTEARLPKKILNIGSGIGMSLNALLAEIQKVTGLAPNVRYTSCRPFDVPANILDIALARDTLGWGPRVDLTDGLRATMEYLRNIGKDPAVS